MLAASGKFDEEYQRASERVGVRLRTSVGKGVTASFHTDARQLEQPGQKRRKALQHVSRELI